MTNYKDIDDYRSDGAVLSELGSRMGAMRLTRNMTQAQLAREAGVSKRTLERIEAGRSAQITSFIRVLRALNVLERLELLLPPTRPGPMDLLKNSGRPPQRASGSNNVTEQPWQWGEDE